MSDEATAETTNATTSEMTSDESAADESTADEAMAERMEVQRTIPADAATIFRVLRDPQGHVAIDSSGMLMAAEGEPVTAVGDSFVVHMDREALNDYPLGHYDVTVSITTFVPDREIAWTIRGKIRPQIGHIYGYRLEPADEGTLVTSYYDWSEIDPVWKEAGIFPIMSEGALRATLGILDRTIARGGVGASPSA
jgi:Polyketide cyclase / dehydrase and lipid transport